MDNHHFQLKRPLQNQATDVEGAIDKANKMLTHEAGRLQLIEALQHFIHRLKD